MGQTPSVRPGRCLIDGYGGGGFRVAGETHRGPILVLPDRALSWPVADIAGLTVQSFTPVMESEPRVEILLIGCGKSAAMIPPALRQALREKGVVIDAMDTGAACRTYNVLLAEERRVAAALLAVE
jgi:uncharacterized protein